VRGLSSDLNYLAHSPNRRCPDICKARNHLGYSPWTTLDEGLRRLLIWYSENP